MWWLGVNSLHPNLIMFLNSTAPFVLATEVFPLSSCFSFRPTFHHHTGFMEMFSQCQHTSCAHNAFSPKTAPYSRHHRRSDCRLVLETREEKWDEAQPWTDCEDVKNTIFFIPKAKQSISPSQDSYFSHGISSDHSIDMKSFETISLFNICWL